MCMLNGTQNVRNEMGHMAEMKQWENQNAYDNLMRKVTWVPFYADAPIVLFRLVFCMHART